ncbi:MAG: hypothetical protein LRY56_12440 [Burkholderiaceae bacterium]|nr:hypothetical protein [Burkholderiaceae bacterium]MCD8538234.1 hypothetical protein [Burkholderiaceae bacterium]
MCCCDRKANANRQSGQVLAEAVVVMLLLVVLLLVIHLSGRWQFQWANQWLRAQIAGDAVALDHAITDDDLWVRRADATQWHNSTMREFSIGEPNWQAITSRGRFSQTAWRLAGAGQASFDRTVVERIERAPHLWRRTELASKAIIYALLPTIRAVEAPWEARGSETQWLERWQGTTPEAYLRATR